MVTVKAYDTAEAAAALATGAYGAALSLQNGMGNEATLAGALGCPVLAGTTSHGAVLAEPGAVEWTGRGEVAVGAWTEDAEGHVDAVVDAFAAAGLNPRAVADARSELWLKLAVNTAINPVTALARVPNGALRDGPAGELGAAAARETARTARADGTAIDGTAAVDRVRSVAEATSDNRSSMLEDVTARRRTEIDQLNGYVVDRAAEQDHDVPVNRALTGLVRAWEAGVDLR